MKVNIGEKYYFINKCLNICYAKEENSALDNKLYESGNYFYTSNEAEKVLGAIILIFSQNKQITDIKKMLEPINC
jgi:hypothetical protein